MIYSYKCTLCEHRQTAKRSMDERHNCPECNECGGVTKKVIDNPEVNGYFLGGYGNPGYMCPVTDQWVDSKRKRRNIIAEHDLLEKG